MPWKCLRGGKIWEWKGKSRGVTTSYIQEKGDRKVKDENDEILGFDFVFGG